MKQSRDKRLRYEVIRSRRSTADIIIERDGSVLVRAPEWADDDAVANIVESKHYWIYQGLAEWRDLNASRVLREYKNGEGFLYLGRAYRLSLVGDQREPLQLKNGRFTLRRDVVEQGDIEAAKTAFRTFYVAKGTARLRRSRCLLRTQGRCRSVRSGGSRRRSPMGLVLIDREALFPLEMHDGAADNYRLRRRA